MKHQTRIPTTFPTLDERRAAVRDTMTRADVLLSPMAGISDRVFRAICRDFGADVTYCEFVSADGVLHGNEKTFNLMELGPEETPVGIQLFGSNPARMAEAAVTAARAAPDIIDLNFGCPVKKVVKKNGGSALLANLPLMDEIVRAVVAAVEVPVTAKIRLGWNTGCMNYLETTRMLEEAGVCAVTVHGRTRDQGFRGIAAWGPIAEIASRATVPVIGNGDVWNGEDYLRMRAETGCDAVMIARGAIGNPWVFSEIKAAARGDSWEPPVVEEVIRVLIDHLDAEIELKGQRTGVKRMRRQMASYLKGFPGAVELRRGIFEHHDRDGVVALLQTFAASPAAGQPKPPHPSPHAN